MGEMRGALPELTLEGDLESKEGGKEGRYVYGDMGWRWYGQRRCSNVRDSLRGSKILDNGDSL